jgi:tetratricopeptide (TPR) repeat protein
LGNLGHALEALGQLPEAREAFQQAFEALDRDDPLAPLLLQNMAFVSHKLSEWDQAESLYLQAIEDNRRLLGSEAPQTLLSIKNLAFHYQQMGRAQEALPLIEEALAGTAKPWGIDTTKPSPPSTPWVRC